MLVLGTAVFAHLGLQGHLFIDTRDTQRHLLALNIGLEWLQYQESQRAFLGPASGRCWATGGRHNLSKPVLQSQPVRRLSGCLGKVP